MDIPFQFIQNQKALSLACSTANDVWIANVYVGVNQDRNIFFISPKDNKHSRMILENPKVAFSAVWFEEGNHKNRKGIQGLGLCRLAETEDEISMGVRLHNQNFPDFKDSITVEWIHDNKWGSSVWVLKPTFIKYWDDELYGEDGSEEFNYKKYQ